MKKIAFSDKYGLTKAVIDLIKTNTRRAEKSLDVLPLDYNPLFTEFLFEYKDGIVIGRRFFKGSHVETYHLKPRYKVGEIVAVAQSYEKIYLSFNDCYRHEFSLRVSFVHHNNDLTNIPGWNNKMFVKANLMPHRIRITDIKVERLQDISDDDCMKEGIYTRAALHSLHVNGYAYTFDNWSDRGIVMGSDTAKGAFASLIDRISGRGTWERNPYVYAYSFELVKDKEK